MDPPFLADTNYEQPLMYLKRAPPSSVRAPFQCGMSWWPSVAEGSPTSDLKCYSVHFCKIQGKIFFQLEQNLIFLTDLSLFEGTWWNAFRDNIF